MIFKTRPVQISSLTRHFGYLVLEYSFDNKMLQKNLWTILILQNLNTIHFISQVDLYRKIESGEYPEGHQGSGSNVGRAGTAGKQSAHW